MGYKKILIVEDDVDTCDLYNYLLKARLRHLLRGQCIVRDKRSSQASAGSDYSGSWSACGDGFFVLERFQANADLAEIPVIVVSARDHYLNKGRALNAGAKAFVQKPWNNKELLAIIGQLLDQPEPSISTQVRSLTAKYSSPHSPSGTHPSPTWRV